MIRLQICVQHDPRRADLLPPLLAELGSRAKVIVDPGADEPTRSPWRCYAACLRALQPNVTHLLVIQDDAEVCRDFLPSVREIIAAKSDSPVSLFVSGFGLNGRRILEACYRESRWAQLEPNEFVPVVATVWPRDHVQRILEFVERKRYPASRRADDGILGDYCREERVPVWAPVPGLVEHRDDIPSLVGTAHFAGKNPQRVAACWVGTEMSPLDFDW